MKNTALTHKHIELGAKMVPFAGYNMPVQYVGINAEHETVRRGVGVFDVSHMGEFILKGHKALDLIQRVTSNDASKLYDGKVEYYTFNKGKFAGVDNVLVSATGYTGAGGFEIYVDNKDAEQVWDAIFKAGAPYGIKPIGLGARDTLRLEMGFCLYGNDIDDNT